MAAGTQTAPIAMAGGPIGPSGGQAKTSWAPTAKVSSGALAAAFTTLLVGVLKNHVTWVNDTAVVGALTSILTFIVQYMVPERK